VLHWLDLFYFKPDKGDLQALGHLAGRSERRGNAVTTFWINRETGQLSFIGQYTPVGTPAIIIFLA